MSYTSSLGSKKRSRLSLSGTAFFLIILSGLMFSACAADAGVNGNGSNNGAGNGNNGVCSGYNNCNNNANPNTNSGQSSGGGNQNSGNNSQPTTSSGGYCGLGTWEAKGVSSNDKVQGPAVITGVYSVNDHDFSKGGVNDLGYIAVLEDTGSYTVNSSGTSCHPYTGNPSLSDIQTVINTLVLDQRGHGCGGGCHNSLIQRFSAGNPDGTATIQ